MLIVMVSTLAVAIIALPFYSYEQTRSGKWRSSWYSIDNYDSRYLIPNGIAQAPVLKMSDEKNWQNFHFQDVLIPLPVRNPFYFTAPIFDYDAKTNKIATGIQLFLPSGRVISEVKFRPLKTLRYQLRSQKLFQLPLVRKVIKRVERNKIWKDIFTKKIDSWRVSIKEMLYNLYLIQMRSWILPENFIQYQWLDDKNQLALITLNSKNKDFTTEVVLKKYKSTIYSYLLLTRTKVDVAQAFRSKFLNSIKFREGHPTFSNIIYREFQGLRYDKKIDHEGMLYLLSSWSHNMSNKKMIREMVEYLERGNDNQKQLEPIYKFAMSKWNTTFSTKHIDGLSDNNIKLKRSIEHEQLANEKRLLEEQARPIEKVKPPTPKEQMQQLLQQAKRDKKARKNNKRLLVD